MMNYEMISYLEEIKEDQNSDCQIKIDRIIPENKCEKIHLSAKFFVKEASHFFSNNNNSNSREIARQASLARIHIASNEEVKIFCGVMKKKYVNTIIPFSLDVCIGARVIL